MFGKADKQEMAEIIKSSTIIGKGTVIEGNIDTVGNISVDGKLIGNLKTKSKINLGHTADIEGNVYAQNAEIAGHIKGVLEVSELLILKPTSVIDGDIITNKLKVEEGAVINGSCKMGAIIKDIKGKSSSNEQGQERGKEKTA